jgi:hypothetical protein
VAFRLIALCLNHYTTTEALSENDPADEHAAAQLSATASVAGAITTDILFSGGGGGGGEQSEH